MNKIIQEKSFIAFLFVALAIWNALILTAPLMAASSNRFLSLAGGTIYYFMDPVCHQLPQRSLWLGTLPLAVCARCTTIYLAGLFVVGQANLRSFTTIWPRWIYVSLFLISLSDIVAEKLNWMVPAMEWRLVDGLMMGMVIFRLILEGFAFGTRTANK